MGKPSKNQKMNAAIDAGKKTRAENAQKAIQAVLTEFNCELKAQLAYGTTAIRTYVAIVAKPDAIQKAAEEKSKQPESETDQPEKPEDKPQTAVN